MADDKRSVNIELIGGSSWFIAWLFTIGWAELSFWEGVFALIVWPYFLGIELR